MIYVIDDDKLKLKKNNFPAEENAFICGAMDHSPQEFINQGATLTSTLIIYNAFFHKQFHEEKINIKKWSSMRKQRRIQQFNNNWELLQRLPFFAYVLSASDTAIHAKFNDFLKFLKLQNNVKIIENNGKKFHHYYRIDKQTNKKMVIFELPEKISLAALHIASFIIKAYLDFRSYCEQYKLGSVLTPFQIYHDRFPGDNRHNMGEIIGSLISCSQYYGYPTREISLMHWMTQEEQPDDLLADNIAGFCNYVVTEKKTDTEKWFIEKNTSIIKWEKLS